MPNKDGSWNVTLPAVDCENTRPHDHHEWVNEYDNRFFCIGQDGED